MAYKYITTNNLYKKQSYMYSEYEGEIFIKEYLDSRRDFLSCQKKCVHILRNQNTMRNMTQCELLEIRDKLNAGVYNKGIIESVDAYTKSFEVRKRIYTGYDANRKPLGGAGFEDYESYLLFADCLLGAFRQTKCLKYYSCLLKLDDTLLSISEKLVDQLREYLCNIIGQELDIFYQLADENGLCWESEE